MKIHEYQAKSIFEKYSIPVTKRFLIAHLSDADAVVEQAFQLFENGCVVKAQIHAGGRGKGGGVKVARSKAAAIQLINELLGMTLVTHQTGEKGQLVRKVILEPLADIDHEYYVAITLDRTAEKNVIMATSEGGVDIEQTADTHPEKIIKEWVSPGADLMPYQARNLAYGIGLKGDALKQGVSLFMNLYRTYISEDASIVEINPLVKTSAGDLLALDAKINFDDDALYRHQELALLRDKYEEDASEVEAKDQGLNYIKLDGNVGCMVNGAGLAMATMDIIKLEGGEPANFLDVGGKATAETISKGFGIILKDDNVKAILVNIFGGIVRCDRVANGIIQAVKTMKKKVPIVVRLSGTNADEAHQILNGADVDLISAACLKEAAQKVVAVVSKRDKG